MKELIISELTSLVNSCSFFKEKDKTFIIRDNNNQSIEWFVINHPITDKNEIKEFQKLCIQNSPTGQLLAKNFKIWNTNGQKKICININDIISQKEALTISTVKSPPLISHPYITDLAEKLSELKTSTIPPTQVQSKEIKVPREQMEKVELKEKGEQQH